VLKGALPELYTGHPGHDFDNSIRGERNKLFDNTLLVSLHGG